MRNWVILLAVLSTIPASADTRFRVRQTAHKDAQLGRGQCDIRLQVDDTVQVSVRRDMVDVHTIRGQDARDDGSECNLPMPGHDVRDFRFQVMEKRNDIRLVEPPSPRNDFAAIVEIHDGAGGFGRYIFRLSWEQGPLDLRREEAGSTGLLQNNVIHFRGRGQGEFRLNGRDPQRLRDANVDIDQAGRIMASFRGDGPRPVVYTGTVIAREPGRIKADVATEDGRLHGPMYLTVDGRQNITSIALDATNGQERLHLEWNGR